ncbi:type III-B CRISPR module RAMP protein Cmr6 [Limisphaera sp. VF-2]|jgi:CRISPR-associated protein Cmr6|uniref:type III-B CRISPR module RAMP protein Cmr6 n=1 Tax=Limisphaera sp. VF-2 TaxID=3400418 RepID=UPI0017654507
MKLPLYFLPNAPRACPARGHTGLWFDKFCNQWADDPEAQHGSPWSLKARNNSNPKLDWIRTVTGQPIGDKALLASYALRITALADALGGQIRVLKSISRLATGLGRDHPIENGFTWHPSLGTPYLPGSSVKGLVRAWAESGGAGSDLDAKAFQRIFGSGPRGPTPAPAPPSVGSVIFFDAVPVSPVRLKPDVMTVHYANYYQGKPGDRDRVSPPADWLEPEPIPFLTLAPGALFLFALAPRTRSPEAVEDARIAADWLVDALGRLGIGAKTAVGYGRLTRDPSQETELRESLQLRKKEREQEMRLARLSPLARELETDIAKHKWETDKNAFTRGDLVERWVERLEKDPVPDALQRLKALLEMHFPGILADPDKTGGKSKEYVHKERWRKVAKRLNQIPV